MDQREFPRMNVVTTQHIIRFTEWRSVDANIVLTRNVSASGFCFRSAKSYAAGEYLLIYLNNSVLDVEIQAVAKEFASIAAPFEGLISDLKFPDPGINVGATDVIAAIVDPETVYFEAEVDEVEIGKIFAGQEAEVVFDAYPEETVFSRVSEIGFSPVTLSGGGKGYRVKLTLPGENRDLKYKLGMSGDAKLAVAEKVEVLTLPAVAVSEKEGKKLVKQKQGKEVVEKEITVGLETEERVEILEGVREGEKVIVEIRKN